VGWITAELQTTTPLFNAGADQQDAGVRVSSLRGAMRFWFRALAGSVTGADLGALAGLEQRVFGSAAASSPLALRIPNQPAVRLPNQRHDFPLTAQIVYLLGQGLGDLANRALRRPYVPPGQKLIVKLRFQDRRDDTRDERAAIRGAALAALWLTCTYGGVGARVRRGFGGLRILSVDGAGELPDSWPPDRLTTTPSPAQYESLNHLPAGDLTFAIADIRTLTTRTPTADEPPKPPSARPAFPVLDPAWTYAGLSKTQSSSWDTLLTWAGEQLRHFRANQPNTNPKANYQPKIKTPEWDAVVHGPGTSFPLGALGLPVVYKDGYTVDAVERRGLPARRASALWLRPVGEGTTWRLLSFAFANEFLPGPDAPTVTLRRKIGPPKPLQVADTDVDHIVRKWIDVHKTGKSFTDPGIHR
jgi:CRISPR type III-B/RAMP module RAMP protein Cmr1